MATTENLEIMYREKLARWLDGMQVSIDEVVNATAILAARHSELKFVVRYEPIGSPPNGRLDVGVYFPRDYLGPIGIAELIPELVPELPQPVAAKLFIHSLPHEYFD